MIRDVPSAFDIRVITEAVEGGRKEEWQRERNNVGFAEKLVALPAPGRTHIALITT